MKKNSAYVPSVMTDGKMDADPKTGEIKVLANNTLDLRELIYTSIENINFPPHVKLDKSIQIDKYVKGDRALLGLCITYLIVNAIQAIPETKQGHIELQAEAINEEFEIFLLDSGQSISRRKAIYISSKKSISKKAIRILEKLQFKLNSNSEIRYLVNIRNIVEAHGGAITAKHRVRDSNKNIFSLVHIRIPIK